MPRYMKGVAGLFLQFFGRGNSVIETCTRVHMTEAYREIEERI